MEKLGVQVDATEKTASTKTNKSGVCPICHRELDPNSNVSKCPIHGTRPFEESQNKKDEL